MSRYLYCCFLTKSIQLPFVLTKSDSPAHEKVTLFLRVGNWTLVKVVYAVADLLSKVLDASPPGSKLFQFHAVYEKIWQNCMLASPLEGWRPHIGGNLGFATAMSK